MESDERKKREKPDRTQPERDFSNLFGLFTEHFEGNSKPDSETGTNWSDNVAHGVNLGYRVIEEQIRQGQRIAQQFNSGSYDAGAMNNDMQGLAKNIQHYCEDTIQLYARILESLSGDSADMKSGSANRSGDFNQGIASMMESFARNISGLAEGASRSNANPTATASKIAFSVACKRPLEIDVNLQSTTGEVRIDRLYESDMDKPPITGISLDRSPQSQITLQISVSDDQPAGHYSGVLYDPVTKAHCGTLSVIVPA